MYSKNKEPQNRNIIYSGSKYSLIPEMDILYKLTKKHQDKNTNDDILENMTAEGHSLKKGSLNQILDMINERYFAKNRQLYEIDRALCELHTQQFQLDAVYSEMNKRLKTSLEQVCSKMELDKTKAKIDAWQDITKLRKELIPLITEYMSSLRKVEILNGNYKNFKDYEYGAEEELPEFPVRIP